MESSRIRNVAVIGPHAVGKTTLVEAMLFDMAVIPTRGRVELGTATMDFDGEAIARGMSVGTGVAQGEWQGVALNLLDTPGHSDFLVETRFALAAADAALLVVSAAKGIDANVMRAYRLAREAGLPVMVFVNGIDAEGARDYGELLEEIRARLDAHAIPLELPVGRGKGFKGDVDLIGMRTWYFAPDSGTPTEVAEPPSELRQAVARYHTELVEAIAEQHDELLERYLNGEEPTPEVLAETLKRDMREGQLLPVLIGSANVNIAIRPLLDAIVALLPSPLDRRYADWQDAETGEWTALEPASRAPVALAIFKTFSDPYMGKVSVFRVLRGSLTADTLLMNTQRGGEERFGRLFKLVGKRPMAVERLEAGDIGGVAKLKEAQTGDTWVLASADARPWRYAMPEVPPAIWSVAIEPAAKQNEAKLAISLAKLREEDPALMVSVEPRSHRTVLAGQGATHLDVAIARLENRYKLKLLRSEPPIPYRETVTGSAQGQGRHKKQSGGRGQYGDVWLRIEPLARGEGFEFVDAVVGGAVPRSFIPAVEKAVRESLELGLLAGYPIVDVRVTLYDGSSHAVDSSEQAFKNAAHLAMKAIFANARPVLLEPIMAIKLGVPAEALGDAIGDLNARRAQIEGIDANTVHAKLPLAELAGLMTSLQNHLRGQVQVESHFEGYSEVPAVLQTKLLAAFKGQAIETR